MNLDADDAPCGNCGKDVHLHNDPPCPHGYVACDGCGWDAVCTDCFWFGAQLDSIGEVPC